jgi:probable HAF family extracellular repeat protein
LEGFVTPHPGTVVAPGCSALRWGIVNIASASERISQLKPCGRTSVDGTAAGIDRFRSDAWQLQRTQTSEEHMSTHARSKSTIVTLLAALVFMAAARSQQPMRYSLRDLGTLGGTFSSAVAANNSGVIAGSSTPTGDAVAHAVTWRKGAITDLGTLGGPNSFTSEAASPINDRGEVAGLSAIATVDPYAEGFCDALGSPIAPYLCRPFVWSHGVMTELPTLGGNNAAASAINNRGEVTGFAETATLDPTCPPPQVFAYEAAVWKPAKGEVQELPPLLGDTISGANGINDNGQVAGASGTCAAGPIEAVLCKDGRPIDLGNLGGVTFNIAFAVNNQGQVVGQSDLPGDATHHAFLWQHGVMSDLGTLPGLPGSLAASINNTGQVVGFSDDFQGNEVALLWQDGVMIDLNTRIPAELPVFLLEALGINDRGQITGFMLDIPSGEIHGYLLTPVESNAGSATAAPSAGIRKPPALPEKARQLLRRGMNARQHWPAPPS